MSRWLYLSILFTVTAFAGSLYIQHYRYDELPAQVPIHWDMHGQPDGFVPKSDAFLAFLLLPAVMAGVVGLTLLLPWLSPQQFEIDAFRSVYGYIMMMVTALLGFIHLIALWGSLNPQLPLDRLLVGGFCVFFVLIGAPLGQVKRNFWVGVRTPWTLASEAVWDRTHWLSARLFVAAGVLGLLIAIVGLPIWLCFVGILTAALVPVAYSLVLYKRLQYQGRV